MSFLMKIVLLYKTKLVAAVRQWCLHDKRFWLGPPNGIIFLFYLKWSGTMSNQSVMNEVAATHKSYQMAFNALGPSSRTKSSTEEHNNTSSVPTGYQPSLHCLGLLPASTDSQNLRQASNATCLMSRTLQHFLLEVWLVLVRINVVTLILLIPSGSRWPKGHLNLLIDMKNI